MANMIIANTLIMLNLNLFAGKCLTKRNISKILYFSICFISIGILSFINYPNNKLLGFFIMTLFYALFIFFIYDSELFKKLLVLLLFSITVSYAEIFAANTMSILFELGSEQLNTMIYLIALLLSNALTFLVLHFLSNIIINISNIKHLKLFWICLILPFTTIVLLLNIPDYFNTFNSNKGLFLVMIGLLLSNFLFLHIMVRESKQMEIVKDIEKMKIKNELLKVQYDANFSFFHDTIRKLLKLDKLLNSNDYKEAHSKVLELNRDMIKFFNVINANSEIIGTYVNYNIAKIIQYNINMNTIIETNDFSFLSINYYIKCNT